MFSSGSNFSKETSFCSEGACYGQDQEEYPMEVSTPKRNASLLVVISMISATAGDPSESLFKQGVKIQEAHCSLRKGLSGL